MSAGHDPKPDTPYKGLMPYSEEDTQYFFGREVEREIITSNLMASRLTLLYGATGVGKSSVLRAGVSHHLRQLGQQNLSERGTPEFVVVVFSSWRDDPVQRLEARVQESVAQAFYPQTRGGVPSSGGLAETLHAWTEHIGGDLLIILDQFEEYFLYHPQEDVEGTFALEFPRAVNRRDLRVNFLVSIREDAIAKLDRFKGRVPNLFDNYLRIEHLDREAARTAIEKPIEQYNRLRGTEEGEVSIERELVEAVLEQVRTGQFVLGEAGRGVVGGGKGSTSAAAQVETPYLQLVMTRLWDEERGAGSQRLRLATLNRLGGSEQIVKSHLDGVMGQLPSGQREVSSRIFNYLVTPEGTKIALPAATLARWADLTTEQVEPVLNALSGGETRILRQVESPPGQAAATRFEIFHDKLAPAILDWRARFVEAQERAEAEKQLARERRRATRLGLGVIGMSLLLIMVAALASYALQQRNAATLLKVEAVAAARLAIQRAAEAVEAKKAAITASKNAETERDRAEEQARLAFSRELAAAAINNLAIDPERSILLALYAVNKILTPEAEDALHRAVQASRVRLTLSGHTDAVNRVAFRPDGRRLATASADRTAKVWDAASGEVLLTLSGHTDKVWGIAFSPDGKRVATVSDDKTLKVWDAVSGQELRTLSGHTGTVYGVAFSPDGRHLATASADRTAKVWGADSGQLVHTLSGHTGVVYGVNFSIDGKWVATASVDKTAKVWDAASGQELRTLSGHLSPVLGVAFSPDGRHLATASEDLTARVWDAASGQKLRTLSGHTNTVMGVAFSPDGTRLATASTDRQVKVWDPASGQELHTLSGHTDWVRSVAFSRDGTRLATASEDRTAKVWDAASGQELRTLSGHTNPVWRVAFSPDGTRLATASFDKTAKVWDAASGHELHTLSGHTNKVYSVAFSPDGRHLATASADRTVRLYALNIEDLIALARTRVTRELTLEECRKYLHVKQCPPTP